MSFTCPKCNATSYNPNDELYEYCGNCHEFTGGYGYGHERHSSGSNQAQSNGKMQMREESEQGEAELSQMQRDGKDNRLRELRGFGMGWEDEQEMREMRGNGMPVAKPTYEPSMYRFYIGSLAVGITVGMVWLSALQRFMTPSHAERTMYGIVAFIFGWQAVHLWREHKRLNILRAALDRDWEHLKAKYPDIVELEQYKAMEKVRWGKR